MELIVMKPIIRKMIEGIAKLEGWTIDLDNTDPTNPRIQKWKAIAELCFELAKPQSKKKPNSKKTIKPTILLVYSNNRTENLVYKIKPGNQYYQIAKQVQGLIGGVNDNEYTDKQFDFVYRMTNPDFPESAGFEEISLFNLKVLDNTIIVFCGYEF